MEHLNHLLNVLFGVMLSPFQGRGIWYGMIAVSLISSIVLLTIFKVTSKQQAIRRNKNRAVARLLELLLFKDDIVVNLGALWRTTLANVAYMGTVVRPLLFSLVPFALILIQVSVWFANRPLKPGETVLMKATFTSDAIATLQAVSVEPTPGVTMDTQVVRIPSRNEVAWRIRAGNNGPQSVDLLVDGASERKTIVVGDAPCPVSPVRVRAGLWTELTNPSEAPLPAAGSLVRIKVDYPSTNFTLAGFHLHWLLVYIILTMVMAWALKKPFRVEI